MLPVRAENHSGSWGYPRLSVALCTFNGEDYLPEQLESLLTQTRPPDELVVCDDASADATFSILEAFAACAPFPVRLFRNPVRLGVRTNFEQAIRLCGGDVICLSDQDDVWASGKLARFDEAFASGETAWAFCDAEVVDAGLRPLDYTMWQLVAFMPEEQQRAAEAGMFFVLLRHYVVAGATMAFRAELRDRLLPVPSTWPYDAWLAAVAAAVGPCHLIEEPLQRYRQHDANAVGGRRRPLGSQVRQALQVDRRRYYQEELARWQELVQRLDGIQAKDGVMEALSEKIAHLERRARLPAQRLLRLPGVVAEVLSGGYRRYARNWGSVALDLLLK